jgi:hypothetical protein
VTDAEKRQSLLAQQAQIEAQKRSSSEPIPVKALIFWSTVFGVAVGAGLVTRKAGANSFISGAVTVVTLPVAWFAMLFLTWDS